MSIEENVNNNQVNVKKGRHGSVMSLLTGHQFRKNVQNDSAFDALKTMRGKNLKSREQTKEADFSYVEPTPFTDANKFGLKAVQAIVFWDPHAKTYRVNT